MINLVSPDHKENTNSKLNNGYVMLLFVLLSNEYEGRPHREANGKSTERLKVINLINRIQKNPKLKKNKL
jgi:hypothetical protein